MREINANQSWRHLFSLTLVIISMTGCINNTALDGDAYL
jgi:outer membrane lipoprotein SlyB